MCAGFRSDLQRGSDRQCSRRGAREMARADGRCFFREAVGGPPPAPAIAAINSWLSALAAIGAENRKAAARKPPPSIER